MFAYRTIEMKGVALTLGNDKSDGSILASTLFAAFGSVFLTVDGYLIWAGLLLFAVFGVISLIFGIVACVQGRRLFLMSLSAPLLTGYLVLRAAVREPILWRAQNEGRLWGQWGMNGTSGVVVASIFIVMVSLLFILLVGRFRIGRTNPWYLAAGSVTVLAFILDLYGYEAEENNFGHRLFAALAFWLVVSGAGFAALAVREMSGKPTAPARRRLFGAIGVASGTVTIGSALAAGSGILQHSMLDVFHIDVLGREIDPGWLTGIYIAIGAAVIMAGVRAFSEPGTWQRVPDIERVRKEAEEA